MTTGEPDSDRSRLARLEARMDQAMDNQAEIRADHRETNRRIDRLFFYALIGIGGGIIAALIVMIIRGNPAG